MPTVPIPVLVDEFVSLRRWRSSDVPAMLEAFSDPVFVAFSDWAPQSPVDALDYLDRRERERLAGTAIDLAIVDPHEPAAVLGGASLNDIDTQHLRANVGYWLSPVGRGRGLATRAVNLLAEWAFTDLVLARLELTCGPDNIASQRVAARCGFLHEGVLRSHMSFRDGRRDTVVFSRLR